MARRFKPIYGLFVVLVFMAAVLVADLALVGGLDRRHQRVGPDQHGLVVVDVGDLGAEEVRFYRFLNPGNQEVKFLVGRDGTGTVQVAFDAAENDFKRKRGFRHDGGAWLVNNKCDTAVRLAEVNDGSGGCQPVPLPHRVEGERLVLREDDILRGWRYFR